MSKHTPGPWLVDDDRSIVTTDGSYISIQHNADLIAAAPEMYEALREALEAISWQWYKGNAFQDNDGQPILGRIQTALAKAEGRS